jgi:hypothetical protein
MLLHRPGVKIQIGVHGIDVPPDWKWGPDWGGTHWANADPEFGIERRIKDRAARLSQHNLERGFGVHAQDAELDMVYVRHAEDPVVVP